MNSPRTVKTATMITSSAVSLAIFLFLPEHSSYEPTSAVPWNKFSHLDDALTEISTVIKQAVGERIALNEKISEIKEKLFTRLEKHPLLVVNAQARSKPAIKNAIETIEPIDLESEFPDHDFSAPALFQLGLSTRDIDYLQDHYNQLRHEKIIIDERAVQQDYVSRSRHTRELGELQDQFRQDVGEQNYDLVLYATSQMNRVQVNGVLRASIGDSFGLETGDVIYRYAEKRIFSPDSLSILTRKTDRSEYITIQVIRHGELVTLTVVGGVLGAKYEHIRTSPPGSVN